ncbi:antiviral reverse transcriptase Drt3b [Novosphingobium sp. KACC 22771]|uniref:antiviral reverse transcriptase Drt3b n=1 Tax=Novosphingobium sp. KACC 22771 TaxID=3025670 RepID=UPI0023653D0B|nr:antiviral reverse transcriptase Drt3b [Novosphingobium sp. KACC 22771]WDF73613.1 RNA-directed DNA polymerase [Novosphingobium sp. KACC 22771]
MRKRVIAKGNIHSSDHLRALITDTMPGDIPIIISNDGFYRNVKAGPHPDIARREFVERLLVSPKQYTKPYRYYITKGSKSSRKLSLIHPSGQLAIAKFYQDDGHLICYHSKKSEASIRSPRKVGSLFFVKGPYSERNKFKKSGVDTVDIENSVSNPASYFSYNGVDRSFKFFNSPQYMGLEKKYPLLCFADIAKCFHSLYTHTLYWATADIETAKDNTSHQTFSNRFDRLMQSVNFNETNGICVGAEVSRVFAELILSEIDKKVIARLKKMEIRWKEDYEFRRYVDDFFIFSQSDNINSQILVALEIELSNFNLHLNSEKTSVIRRPFVTDKSHLVHQADKALTSFFERFIVSNLSGDEGYGYSYPQRVWRSESVLRIFLDDIKTSCFDKGRGYDAVGNYIIGALSTRVTALIASFDRAIQREDATPEDFVGAIGLLLEAIYFFYNVDPTISSSLRVAQSAILSFDFFKAKIPDRTPFLREKIVLWTYHFISTFKNAGKFRTVEVVPLEAINVLLVLGEVGLEEALVRKSITDFCEPVDNLGYFEIVSYLFCIKGNPQFQDLRDSLFKRAEEILLGGEDIRIDAQSAFLALDLLGCPYINRSSRAKLFNKLRKQIGLTPVTVLASQAAVETFEQQCWFVQWDGPNLLHMIRKKELSSVY